MIHCSLKLHPGDKLDHSCKAGSYILYSTSKLVPNTNGYVEILVIASDVDCHHYIAIFIWDNF